MIDIAAGDLPHRITFQAADTSTRDEYGQKQTVWKEVCTVWGQLTPISAHTINIAKSFKTTTSHLIRLRYRTGLLPSMRVLCRGRVFSIDGIINVEERDIELNVYCTEVAGVTP